MFIDADARELAELRQEFNMVLRNSDRSAHFTPKGVTAYLSLVVYKH